MKLTFKFLFFFISTLFLGYSCDTKHESQNEYILIHCTSDANSLNPHYSRGGFSNYLSMQIFQTLTGIDYYTEELVGVVADNRPQIEELDSNKLAIKYKIRKGAKFKNGRLINSEDILFSLKLSICPGINSKGSASFYEFIEEVQIDPKDPSFITFICSDNYFINEYVTGDFSILPFETYDLSLIHI